MATEIDKVLATLNDAQGSFDGTTTTSSVQPWSEDLVSFLSTSVLIFSAIALITATILLWRIKITPELVLKTHGIILIIGFTALLLIVGYDNDQLTPIVGLFGAIAGYLLGKEITTNE